MTETWNEKTNYGSKVIDADMRHDDSDWLFFCIGFTAEVNDPDAGRKVTFAQ